MTQIDNTNKLNRGLAKRGQAVEIWGGARAARRRAQRVPQACPSLFPTGAGRRPGVTAHL